VSAAAVLAGLRERGVLLDVEDGRLRVRGTGADLAPADVEAIRAHRSELLELLDSNPIIVRLVSTPESLVAWAREHHIGLSLHTLSDGSRMVTVNGGDDRFREAVYAVEDHLIALLALETPAAVEPTQPCRRCGGRGWHPPCRRAPNPWAAGGAPIA